MRKFTKTHNEVQWLFPNYDNSIEKSNKDYETFESIANDLLIAAHGDNESFTKDDLIDAFMKGASVSQQTNVHTISMINESKKLYKEANDKLFEENKKLLQMINILTEQLKNK